MLYNHSMASDLPDPADLSLRFYPDPVLRVRCNEVETVTPRHAALALRMIEVMREEGGIGLAAPQVGLDIRLFVADVPPPEEPDPNANPPIASKGPIILFNPVIKEFRGEVTSREEGCLSIPDVRGDVLRPAEVLVQGLDQNGKPVTIQAGGLLARCFQHEIDHLDGVLIISKMTQMSRMKNRRAIRELERSA